MPKRPPITERVVAMKLLCGRTPEELRFSFRLLDAMVKLYRAKDDMDAKRERHLCDRRDELRARAWLNACGVYMEANEKVEGICEELRISDRLRSEGELS